MVALIDREGRVARFEVTPGNKHESRSGPAVLKGLPSAPGRVLADRAYSSRQFHAHLAEIGAEAVVPAKSKDRLMPGCDMRTYKGLHLVENAFADLKRFRGLAIRYCKLAETYESVWCLACWVVGTRSTRHGKSPHSK